MGHLGENRENLSTRKLCHLRKCFDSSFAFSAGAGLQELKSQLQQQMKAIRDIHRQEAMYKHRLENEYFDDEEEEFWTTGDVTDRIDSNSKNECKENRFEHLCSSTLAR